MSRFRHRTQSVLPASLFMMGAAMGFFNWNSPAGLIVPGRGSAYFIGFILAEPPLMLAIRNRDCLRGVAGAAVHVTDRRHVPFTGRNSSAACRRTSPTAGIAIRS
jgi:UDP-N-acetylmuramyl pentapeptide phosphotransferase/UDP-N-acetylglucosamine-1-phosphate transferase